jgi:hypothetical protein
MLMFLEFSRRKTGHSQSDCFEKIQGSLSVIEDIANNKGIANNVNNIDMILVFNADWQDRKADELFSLLDFMTNTKDSKTSSLGVFELEFMGVSYKIKCLMYPCNEVDSVINAAFSPNGFLATDI